MGEVVQNDSSEIWWEEKTAHGSSGEIVATSAEISGLRGGRSSALDPQYDVLDPNVRPYNVL